MAVTVELVRTLREQTGAGILECKEALEASEGDLEKAAQALRLKGFAQAAKRSDRSTNQGLIEAYVHTGGRLGALVELGCETDFVARTTEFKELAHDIAMQVVAMAPDYLDKADMEEGATVWSPRTLASALGTRRSSTCPDRSCQRALRKSDSPHMSLSAVGRTKEK